MASSNGADIVNNDASLSIGLTVHYSEPSSRKPQEASTTVDDPESGGAPENDTTSPRQEESPPPQLTNKASTGKSVSFRKNGCFKFFVIKSFLTQMGQEGKIKGSPLVAKPTNDGSMGFKGSSAAATAKPSMEYVLFKIRST